MVLDVLMFDKCICECTQYSLFLCNKGTVSKIADFYGVDLTEEEHEKVVEKCGLKYMKQNEGMFSYTLPLNPSFDGSVMRTGKFIRKGQNGDGQVFFTEEGKSIM